MVRIPAFVLSLALLPGTALFTPHALGAEASVSIISPKDGDKLDVMAQNKIEYEVVPGPQGDHVHVYVDDEEVGILRQLKGSYTFENLPTGLRHICIKVVNKAHVPIGVERCVHVNVE